MRGEVNLQEEDNLTLAEFVKKHHAGPKAVKTINVWARVMLGVEASEVSARFFIEYTAAGGGLLQMRSDQKHGGQYLRFRHGKFKARPVRSSVAGLTVPPRFTKCSKWYCYTSQSRLCAPFYAHKEHTRSWHPCGNDIFGRVCFHQQESHLINSDTAL